jgi:nucleoside-diphosphate-sugar epimerase
MHAATLDSGKLGTRRNLSMPGISATVGEQIEALRKVAGDKAASLIRREPDQTIMRIVEGWPQNFDARRALALGFRADASFEDIIRIHVADELQGTPQPRTNSA